MQAGTEGQPHIRIEKELPVSVQPHPDEYFANPENLRKLKEEWRKIAAPLTILEAATDLTPAGEIEKARLESEFHRVSDEIAEFNSRLH